MLEKICFFFFNFVVGVAAMLNFYSFESFRHKTFFFVLESICLKFATQHLKRHIDISHKRLYRRLF